VPSTPTTPFVLITTSSLAQIRVTSATTSVTFLARP
jgi:hypothetical protein